ncbi:MAG: DUF2961 domain-containing protein [Planctomycetes bacterium]|nr:DUF2961 domain-containing protein [Planctomycetota bacterium]
MLAALAALVLQSAPAATQPVGLARLLAEFADPEALARFPDPPYRLEGSAVGPAPARGGSTDEFVLLDVAGPGAVVRVTASDPAARVRVLLDGSDEPVLDAELRALAADACEGLLVLDLPIPFARSARVTTTDPAARIAWRRYASGVPVASFAPGDLEQALRALEQARAGWSRGATQRGEETFRFHLSRTVPAGELLSNPGSPTRGPRAIHEIQLQIDAADPARALAGSVLRMAFDGEECVAVPLGALFGAHDELRPRHDAFRTVTEAGLLVARFVMPYRESCSVRIDHAGDPDLHVSGSLRTSAWEWDERSLHFHAAWLPAAPPASGRLRLTGRGVLLGEDLALSNPALEPVQVGALQARVDGASAVRLPGSDAAELVVRTGSVRTGCATALRAGAFLDPWPPFGRAHAFVWRLLDRLPFERELELVAGELPAPVPRASLLLWYGAPGAGTDASEIPRDPSSTLPRLAYPTIAGAVEAESMPVSAADGVELAPGACDGLPCSGGHFLRARAARPGERVELRVRSAPGRRAVQVRALTGRGFGRVRFAVDGRVVGEAFDARDREAELAGPVVIDLGVHEVGSSFRLLVDVAELGTGPATFGIDAIVVR